MMRNLLLALALAAAGVTAVSPVDAQPGYGRHYGYGRYHYRGYRGDWNRPRYGRTYRGRYYNHWSHGRSRYYQYREGRRRYGWR